MDPSPPLSDYVILEQPLIPDLLVQFVTKTWLYSHIQCCGDWSLTGSLAEGRLAGGRPGWEGWTGSCERLGVPT